MRLRTVVTWLFAGAIGLLFLFMALSASVLWSFIHPVLPDAITLGGAVVPAWALLATLLALLVLLFILVLALFTLLFNRLIVAPLVALTTAMATFTENQSLTRLPPLSRITELQELTRAFIAYTNGVEAVHARDKEISRVKSDFISTAAHQLRTPLTGIRWALEALQKDQLTQEQHALVESAVGKSRDLVGIVGTLLDISSIESGKHQYRFEPIAIDQLAATVAQDFAPMAQEHSVTVSVVPPPAPLPPARADRQQITWVLNNLIENAIRYTPAGGTATVSFAQVPDRVQVLVRDTGIGIPQKDRNNIFERFYRAENAIQKENGGNGLGLYIARTIATDHGGDLHFENNAEGPGTTFTLSLPVAHA